MSRARERHRRYYLALASENPEDWQRIGANYEQIQRAWEGLLDSQSLFAFLNALRTYQERRGLWGEHLAWSRRLLQVAVDQGLSDDEGILLNNIVLRKPNKTCKK